MKSLSQVVLRIGLSLVIIWFGTQQLLHPTEWISFLPGWASNLPISETTFIYLNGWFEVTFGICLLIGFYTRIVSFFLVIHLLGIVFTLGYNSIAVRDFGLSVALASIFLHGSSDWSLDSYLAKKNSGETTHLN